MNREPRPLRVLFRVAAGPRVGFGHLVRAASLAQALGARAWISVRGAHPSVARTARRLGLTLVRGAVPDEVLSRLRPQVLIVDDRVVRESIPWRRAARRQKVPIASIHDLGIGVSYADLLVDGSIGATATVGGAHNLLGTRYAILNPGTLAPRQRPRRPERPADVIVALGGGPRRQMALRLAQAVVAVRRGARVAIAGGFVNGLGGRARGVQEVDPARFGSALASARVAVVGGGVTLYECLALGVPCVALSVVPSQRPTVAAFAARRAVLDGGSPRRGSMTRVAGTVIRLLDDASCRRELRLNGQRLVDGRGAARVAAAVGRLAAAGQARTPVSR
jgi:UDP-2,4-diacetamido-2,4,6-trideoxy-beta-L-altropyranose hydrolase